MLIATALPFSAVHAHTITEKQAPVVGYLYFMLSVGAAYFLFLLVRLYRQRQQDQINSSNNKN